MGGDNRGYGHRLNWFRLFSFVLVSGPDAPEMREILIKLNGLMPYELIK